MLVDVYKLNEAVLGTHEEIQVHGLLHRKRGVQMSLQGRHFVHFIQILNTKIGVT